MADKNIADVKRNRHHWNAAALHRAQRRAARHAMRVGGNLRRAKIRRNLNQPEADDDCVGGQGDVGRFRKQRTLIVAMDILIFRTEYWHIAAPLIRHDPVVHHTANNPQDFAVEEKLRREAWRIKRHRQKIAVWTAVRFARVPAQIRIENRQKGLAAFIDQPASKMAAEYAKPALSQLGDVLLDCHPMMRRETNNRPQYLSGFKRPVAFICSQPRSRPGRPY